MANPMSKDPVTKRVVRIGKATTKEIVRGPTVMSTGRIVFGNQVKRSPMLNGNQSALSLDPVLLTY